MPDLEIIAVREYNPLETMIVDGSEDEMRLSPLIDLDPDDRVVIDLELEDDAYASDATLQNNTPSLPQTARSRRRQPILQVLARHAALAPPVSRSIDPEHDRNYRELAFLKHTTCILRPGKFVELTDGDFLLITVLLQHRSSRGNTIRGFRHRRNTRLGGILERKLNEVCLLLCCDRDDPRDIMQQSKESINPAELVRARKYVRTNEAFPSNSFREDPRNGVLGLDWLTAYAQLTCRWKLTEYGKNDTSLERLSFDECTAYGGHGKAAAEQHLKKEFRGKTIKGGSDAGVRPKEEDFDVRERARVDFMDPLNFHQTGGFGSQIGDQGNRRRRYTFGDAFCGAGGTSRGAKGAGLRIEWGFDFDQDAIRSYAHNFTGTQCWAIAAHEFITILSDDFMVDILHLSPPCQPFSPAHTRPGQNDEMNQASFFAVHELVAKCKPRVVTLEETFGLARIIHHEPFFRTLIHILTSQGYSVRWRIFDLRDFGLPQPRKRLFIFAACPGEPLPPFPSPTHVDPLLAYIHRGRRAWTTIHQAISSMSPGISLHDPLSVPTYQRTPYNEHAPHSSTITCSDGHGYHPSGRRAFTLREIACLQGFPLEHEFIEVDASIRGSKGKVRKQLGNAVPPIVAKVFFEEVIKSMKKVDSVE